MKVKYKKKNSFLTKTKVEYKVLPHQTEISK